MSEQPTDPPPPAACRTRRHQAGADPAKRAQILAGAAKVFMEKGFDAASMNDIRCAAGVSKGTLYVYFADKVDLFEALIAERRERTFEGLSALLEQDLPLREKLFRFALRVAEVLCSDEVIRAHRIIAGTVERMPELGARFYEAGAVRTHAALRALLEKEAAAGRLDVPDPHLAAVQLVELSAAGLWRARLFGQMREAPTAEEVERTARSAVDMFLRAYGVPRA